LAASSFPGSGENVYPSEVEKVILQHENVLEAIGVQDPERGEAIKAVFRDTILRISVILLRSCRMTLEELSRCALLWGVNRGFSVSCYGRRIKWGGFVFPKDGTVQLGV